MEIWLERIRSLWTSSPHSILTIFTDRTPRCRNKKIQTKLVNVHHGLNPTLHEHLRIPLHLVRNPRGKESNQVQLSPNLHRQNNNHLKKPLGNLQKNKFLALLPQQQELYYKWNLTHSRIWFAIKIAYNF